MSAYALRPSVRLPEVYIHRKPVDFRLGYRGLGVLIEHALGHNPFSGKLYVFTNRQHNKLKILFWEENGFVLYYKALSEATFSWPRHNQAVFTISGQQLNWLIDGYDISKLMPHKKLHYEALS